MSTIAITAWRCDFPTCGHVWYTAKEPLRCAKCKRKNWNKTGGDVIKAPKTRKKRAPAKQEITPPGHITKGDVMEDLGLATTAPGWEKPAATVLPTIVHAPTSERFQEALKSIAVPKHNIGERCPHGWANWLQCEKCNPKVSQ